MKTYPKVLESFYNQPAAILPEKIADVQAFLEAHAGQVPRADSVQPALRAGPREAARAQVLDGVGYLPLFGVIAQRMNLLMEVSGGTSTEVFGRALDNLVADRSVKTVLIVIDSPGGSVFGIAELANKIYNARGEKKVVAIADSMAASAAYWLGAQASELAITTGGMVGSVGVVGVHRDESQKDAKEGVKTTLIQAGDYKTEGHPSQPLSSEGAAYLQKTVDEYYAMFVAAVARGRGVSAGKVKSDFGQGRMVMAQEAVQRGMADRVATLDQIVQRLNPSAKSSTRAQATGWLQARLRTLALDAAQPAPGKTWTRKEVQRRADEVAAQVARDRTRND